MNRRRLWSGLAAAALFLLLGRAASGAYADFRWYAALGAVDVWKLKAGSELLLRLLAFALSAGFAYVNLSGVRHSVVSLVLPRQLGNIEIGEEVPGGVLLAIVVGLSLVTGAVFAIPASDWQGFVMARTGASFDEKDPYFNADLGYFVYWIPFERSVYVWAVCVLTAVTALVVLLYALTPSLKWDRGRIHVSAYVRRHVSLLGGAALVVLAWSFRLDAYSALAHGTAAGGAFGSFDHQMGVPISLILAYAAIGASLVVAWAGWTGQTRIAVAVMTIILLLTPTMRYVLPLAVRWASAPVDEVVRERQYTQNRAGYTRRAFGVESMRALAPSEAWQTLHDAASASVWDPIPLTRAVERTRRRGPVVSSAALTISPSGPVFLSVEEPARTDGTVAGDWSLIRSLAATTDERGAVVRVDASGRFPLDDQRLGRVIVYEGARGDLVVTDSSPTLAAPLMESFRARLAEAWSRQNFRLLGSPTRGARMVSRRDVRERVRALVPFFAQGTRVVPLVHGDSLMWVLELYSATSEYPLARRFGMELVDVNYLRHSATALVQAVTGRVTIIPDDDPDPIARTWMRRLPATLGAKHVAPSLLTLLPPDIDGAELRAEAFAAVGTREEGTMRRSVPAADGADTLVSSHAKTMVWSPAFGVGVWIVPVLDARDRVTDLLVATGGARRELRWFRTADSSTTWGALLERLHHAADSATERAATVQAAGRVRVLPLSNGRFIAIQPFYSWPPDGPPVVSRVAIGTGDSTSIAPSIAAAVGAPVVPGPAPATPDSKQERIRVLYAEMRAALQRGDWQAFGKAFDALGVLLDRR